MQDTIKLEEGSEEFKAIQDEWDSKTGDITLETLPGFLDELVTRYDHDYGTICHAMATAATAAAKAVNRSDQGGITGFQAGFVMWGFLRQWQFSSNKTGLKIIDYDKFLYPQYNGYYEKVITVDTWEAIQKEAASNIDKADADYSKYLLDLEQYRADLVEFVGRNPDYYENKEHFDHLVFGTSSEHDAYKEKIDSGFEFAPKEPFVTCKPDSDVYRHWQSIVNGVVPFNYIVEQ